MNLENLWTPWRMTYVGGASGSGDACVLCALSAADDDVVNLIVHRDEFAYVVLNLFPYNTGHMLVVPYDHVPTPVEATPEALTALMLLTQRLLTALQWALGNQGANIGINVGELAGAGIAGHLHQHVVPRWRGDANFMPIIAGTKVLPELLPVSYAKIRSQLAHMASPESGIQIICLDPTGDLVLADVQTGRLPEVAVRSDDQAVWRQAAAAIRDAGSGTELVGWGGSERAKAPQRIGLTFTCHDPQMPNPGLAWLPRADASHALPNEDAESVERALRHRNASN